MDVFVLIPRSGELVSNNQGWSRVTSLSQETGKRIQKRSKIDFVPNLLSKVQDARIRFLAHHPTFFLKISLQSLLKSFLTSLKFSKLRTFATTIKIFLLLFVMAQGSVAVADTIPIKKGISLYKSRDMMSGEYRKKQEAKIKKAATMYEAQLLGHMLRQMRKTVPKGYREKSYAEKLYSQQLDGQYVEAWGDKGGIGIGDIIYKQIHEKVFPKRPFMAAGPIALKKYNPIAIKNKAKHKKSYKITGFVQNKELSHALTSGPDNVNNAKSKPLRVHGENNSRSLE